MRLGWLWVSTILALFACDEGFRDPPGKVAVSYCGNGTLEGDETCDDGNQHTEICAYGLASCTVCDATCQLVAGATSVCGDGVLDGGHEECDDGNTLTEWCTYGRTCDVCDATCRRITTSRHCGDGVVDADGDESCDDGAENSDTEPDACRTDCRPSSCGDGVVDSDEDCEPGSDTPDCRDDCMLPRCGDGIVDPGEACDPAAGDGVDCSDTCEIRGCGDGILDPEEACDDGLFRPVDVAGRGEGACAIDRDGFIRCFGGSDALRALPPALAEGGATGLTVGMGWACAFSVEAGLICWGEEPVGPDHPVLAAPARGFVRVAAGDAHACGIDDLGYLHCWGRLDLSRKPTNGDWREVVSGRGFSCGLHRDGKVECWGALAFGTRTSRPGPFDAVAAGRHHACASRAGIVECWGDEAAWRNGTRPTLVHDLALGHRLTCGLDASMEIACWGEDRARLEVLPEGSFSRIAMVGDALCAFAGDRITCRGEGAGILQFNADEIPGACRSDCSAPRCGDGVVDPGEACDDGNTADDGNGCSATCEHVGWCGDGIVQSAVETCDEGDAAPESCVYGERTCEVCDETCRLGPGIPSFCGDSRLDPGESCDDGSNGVRFASISVSGTHACGVLEDGRVRCFGDGALDPPPGPFVRVATGGTFACGLTADGSIECWGDLAAPEVEGRYVALEAADDAACALDERGALLCWGAIEAPPAGDGWRAVSLEGESACALDEAGAIRCWGAPMEAPPAGTFHRVAVGSGFGCAVDRQGSMQCWGSGAPANLPRTKVVDLAAGQGRLCVIDPAGMLACVGLANGRPVTDLYRQVTAGAYRACGITEDGVTRCWGGDDELRPPRNGGAALTDCPVDCKVPLCGDGIVDSNEQCDEPGAPDSCAYGQSCFVCSPACTMVPGRMPLCGDGLLDAGQEACDDGAPSTASVARGEDFTCMVGPSGLLRCWGRDDVGQSSPPFGTFGQLAVGARHGCALDRTNRVVCWGASDLGQLEAPAGRYLALTAGRDFTCARAWQGGTIDCWGDVPFPLPLQGMFNRFGAGDRHLCALSSTQEIRCWGADDRGQSTPPAGAFQTLAVGANHACAIGTGVPVCWGDDAHGQATPPAGLTLSMYGSFAAGAWQTCAAASQDGSNVCWGTPPPAGSGTMPQGVVRTLALPRWGHHFACGTSWDGVSAPLSCWGEPGLPEAALPTFNSDTEPDACRSSCTFAFCGDGVVDSGEACDDGNTTAGDGCSPGCTVE